MAVATLTEPELGELHGVCAANRSYWRRSGELDPENITVAAVAAMLRDDLAGAGTELRIARDEAGRLVGFAEILLAHPVDGDPWIGLLLVDGRLRRHGYGRAIATALEDRFRDEGAGRAGLAVLENNPEALAFWTALGYRETDRRPDRDRGRPCIVMHKNLRDRPRADRPAAHLTSTGEPAGEG
ncbi:GNAT family N-acetyltransferase [Actinomadura scrupuli]|uniref:GNAT family N-acetyltransferase n=1 Tax=Actinomadura scrupuli TaxID=559629 RepID=UPI003D984E52